jgi:signal peptidase I
VSRSPFLHYTLRTLWFVALPATLAYFAVGALAGLASLPGAWFFAEQPLPAGIILFTIFEMTLYAYRHHLPGATDAGAQNQNLPIELRRDIDAARSLLEEARRLLEKHAAEVTRDVPAAQRTELDAALDALGQELRAVPLNPERFITAFDHAGEIMVRVLKPWRKGELREYAEAIGIAVLVAFALRAVVVEAFKIPSGSMLPTLQIGDHIFVNKFIYGPTLPVLDERLFESLPPRRGDVIVFMPPIPELDEDDDPYIKRVLGIPGDVIEADDGHPSINGWKVPSCFAGNYVQGKPEDFGPAGELYVEFLEDKAFLALYDTSSPNSDKKGHFGPVTVKAEEVFMFGDNRYNSSDSRVWGGAPFASIRGRAMFIWKPPSGMWSRLFTNVMGEPVLPKDTSPEIVDSIARCLASRPSVQDATPPPPRPGSPRAPRR